MKETVRLLGREHLISFPRVTYRKKVQFSCKALWENFLNLATTKFVPFCHGIKGAIGSLEIDETYVPESVNVTFDTLLNDLTNEANLVKIWGRMGENVEFDANI